MGVGRCEGVYSMLLHVYRRVHDNDSIIVMQIVKNELFGGLF